MCDDKSFVRSAALRVYKGPSGAGKTEIPAYTVEVIDPASATVGSAQLKALRLEADLLIQEGAVLVAVVVRGEDRPHRSPSQTCTVGQLALGLFEVAFTKTFHEAKDIPTETTDVAVPDLLLDVDPKRRIVIVVEGAQRPSLDPLAGGRVSRHGGNDLLQRVRLANHFLERVVLATHERTPDGRSWLPGPAFGAVDALLSAVVEAISAKRYEWVRARLLLDRAGSRILSSVRPSDYALGGYHPCQGVVVYAASAAYS